MSKSQILQIFRNRVVQPARLRLLLSPLRRQLRHLLRKRNAVILLRRRPDVAAGRQHMAVFTDLFKGRALAESGYVRIPVQPRQAW